MTTIKVYSTPTCAYCNMLKGFLTDKQIEFKNIDVSTDQAAAQEMVEKSGQMGVPVSIITTDDNKEEIIVGFDKDRISELLGIKE